jgi:hypothetical protein
MLKIKIHSEYHAESYGGNTPSRHLDLHLTLNLQLKVWLTFLFLNIYFSVVKYLISVTLQMMFSMLIPDRAAGMYNMHRTVRDNMDPTQPRDSKYFCHKLIGFWIRLLEIVVKSFNCSTFVASIPKPFICLGM